MDTGSWASLCWLFFSALLADTWVIFFFHLQNHISCWVVFHSSRGCRQKIFKISDAVLETGEQLCRLDTHGGGQGDASGNLVVWAMKARRSLWGLLRAEAEPAPASRVYTVCKGGLKHKPEWRLWEQAVTPVLHTNSGLSPNKQMYNVRHAEAPVTAKV